MGSTGTVEWNSPPLDGVRPHVSGQPSMSHPPKTRKHLMDPANPRPQRSDPMSLSQVQRWVLSTLAIVTILHLAAGFVVAAMMIEGERTDGRVGLNVLAGVVTIGAVVAARAIHQRSLVTAGLLLGPAVTALGLVLTF
jgi:hypothetical protein